jgi:predicted dehydrogenase
MIVFRTTSDECFVPGAKERLVSEFRAGIVGCAPFAIARGNRSRSPHRLPRPHSHVEAYRAVPRVALNALCDIDPAAFDRYRLLWGEIATYTDLREMIERERLDIVSIVTPDHLHADVFVAACDAGIKGIFLEKPFATAMEDADRMIAAAERSGTKVVINHTRRHDPFFRHAKYLLQEGAIGQIGTIVGSLGGERALLFRNGTHVIDTMLFFADAAPSWLIAELDPRDAGYGRVYKGDGGHDPDTEPGALAMIGFENGIRGIYNSSKRTFEGLELDIQASRGRLRIGNQVAELSVQSPIGGYATQPLPLSTELPSGMVTAINDLIALIEHDGDGMIALREGRATLEIQLGILASADAGGTKIALSGALQPVT